MGKILLNKFQIDELVEQISIEINLLVVQHMMVNPTLMCMLDGAFRFYSDLMPHMDFPLMCDFIKASSYDKKEQKNIKIHKYPKYQIRDKNIILIDDIYDTGNTINYVIDQLQHYHPKSISIVTLLHRHNAPKITHNILKYITGHVIQDEWVAGYGLDDFEGTSRNLNFIYELDKK